jgi:hypothetical protein
LQCVEIDPKEMHMKYGFQTFKAVSAWDGGTLAKTGVANMGKTVSHAVLSAVKHVKTTLLRAGVLGRASKLLFAASSLPLFFAFANNASAQTIGAQLGTMAQEGSTAGGILASMVMYVAALIIFCAGAWALWQSRDPASREPGKVGQGIAAMVLCGLMVSGGLWISKASQTTTGAAPAVSSTAAVVGF